MKRASARSDASAAEAIRSATGRLTLKTVYLHIGRGKTGTTAIQAYLARAREDLARAGIHYISTSEHGGGHQAFAKGFIAKPPAYMVLPQRTEEIRRKIAEEIAASPHSVFLLSSENFPLADLDLLSEWWAGLQLQVRIIFFVRSQDELLESEYNQMVKLTGETRSLMGYADEAFEGADFWAECESWARYFGAENMICRVYDGGRKDVIDRFLSCLPLNGAPLPPFEGARERAYANVSLGASALEVARLLNRVDIEARREFYQPLFAAIADGDVPAVLMSAAQAQQFRARFEESNRKFCAKYLGSDVGDIGGRRYDDAERDRLWRAASEAVS